MTINKQNSYLPGQLNFVWTEPTRKTALITGITGQDGSYLAELLLSKGYNVHGIIRRSSSINTSRIDHIFDKLHLHYGDMSDGVRLSEIVNQVKPDEIYNLAAQSHVKVSYDTPVYTADVTGLGALRILEAARHLQDASGKQVRVYQASSSEMYGQVLETPQTEKTPFWPRSPYGCAKVYAYWQTVNYRESYDMFACNGILFNHDSPRRGETFVTRKITLAAGKIATGKQDKLYLGNLDARRDFGYALEYVNAMWLMLQQDKPDDYVIATGETHSVREFLDEVFAFHGLDWTKYVEIDPKYFRPAEVELLLGDNTKARNQLGWTPKVTFKELAHMMAKADSI